MPKFEVYITGLCLLFFRDNQWHAAFVCDRRYHHLNYSKLGKPTEDLHWIGHDTFIEFSCENGFIGPGDPKPKPPDVLFNLYGDYAHGLSSQGEKVRNLKFRQLPPNGRTTDLIVARFPPSELEVWTPTDGIYWVQEQPRKGKPGGKPVQLIGKVGREVVLRFTANGPLQVKSTKEDGSPFRSEYDRGATIILDNDCKDGCDYNDFLDLYDVVSEGEPEKDRQFACGQVAGGVLNGSYRDMRQMPKFRRGQLSVLNPQSGDCDPVLVEPPPEGNWLQLMRKHAKGETERALGRASSRRKLHQKK